MDIRGKLDLDSTFWNVLAFDNLNELETLKISTCPPLQLHHLCMLSSLKTLMLWDSSSIVFPSSEREVCSKYQFPVECISVSQWGASAKDLTQLLTYFPKLSELNVQNCGKITELGVEEQQAKATTAASHSANKGDDGQIEQHQQQDGARSDGEIAADGLLLLPSQLQKLWILNCREMSLCFSPVDSNREAGRTGGGQGLRSLRSLVIRYCPRFLSSTSPCFLFPSSLESLSLGNMETLLPLSNLTSLIDLSIWDCGDLRGEGLQSLLAQGRLTKLTGHRVPNFFASSEPLFPHEKEFPSSSSKLRELDTDDFAGVLATPMCALLSSSLTTLSFSWNNDAEHLQSSKRRPFSSSPPSRRSEFGPATSCNASLLRCTNLPTSKD
ncbi:hypothetical protein HU200_062910 [Digitaria exilis]|uniref:Uncharacterized protein n=1 Tax=Digitaria exilis TaxID=1010633 RepID=A0A835A2E4_9POAL|nr:hypothetical protein HU200_062910 [Digitaria exilis]